MKIVEISLGEELYEVKVSRTVLKTSLLWRHKRLSLTKPDPLPLLHAAEFFQVNPHNALMLGDSIHDVTAARAAGFQIICVNYGYNHGIDIRTAQPDAVIDSLAQLPQLIEKGDINRCA
ncbi:MAG: hypothetical protein DRR19_16900 [Candidatus Parabeggiatoa sp. nov. 1]|nr:MAG: hypothetical protein DRR19_16900 [Gammaproteobacteria bacterium]